MNRRYGNLPINNPMNPAPRRPPRHPLAFQARRIDEYTGQTIQGFSRHTTALTNIADEETGRTRHLHTFSIPDPTPTGTTRHARITEETAGVDSYKKGGMVKKTGLAYLHKGEMVVPKKDVNKVKKAMKGK